MNQGARLIFFLIVVAASVVTILLWPTTVPVSPIIKVILFSALITGSFSASLIEHYFSKPRDVVANATAALLLFLPTREDLNALGWLYYAIITYYAIMICIASAAILIFSSEPDENSNLAITAQFLKSIATRLGNFKFIYGVAYLSVVILYVDNSSPIFLVLMLYFFVVLNIDPAKSFRGIKFALQGHNQSAVGDVFGVQARNIFLAKLRTERKALKRFELVSFRYKLDGVCRNCVVIDNYLLNDEQWIKMIPVGNNIAELEGMESNVVYYSSIQPAEQIVGRILGTVVEGSSIGLIKFEYSSRNKVSQGKLVEILFGEQHVLYQIVQGTTVEEVLAHKNKSGGITGEAAQLGTWNAEKQRFERFGWVPEINSLVLEPSDPVLTPISPAEIKLGTIPGTAYPVIMNIDDAITHHLAVFGVTGSGKSVFTRWLLKQYVARGVLVICVDNTQEYQKKFSADLWSVLVNEQNNNYIRDRVDIIAREMEKFPNNRNQQLLKKNETEIQTAFATSVDQLGQQNHKLGILNIPDLASTVEGLEYIRLFFSAVFEKARAGAFGARKICIVLEEAHTLVPEWNFNSGDEKRSHALVNTISQIALQGRKYNVGLIVVGQRTANVAKTVLTQCNSVVAFQQFDPTGLEFFSHYMGAEFAQGLSVLQTRRAVAVGKAFAAGVPLIFEIPNIDENAVEPGNPA